jgi:hypothetical protein
MRLQARELLVLEAMRRERARRPILFAGAALLITANSHAKDGDPPRAESDHSVPLPPQPEPPPGVESNAAPLELESLPPPPAAPPGARKRHKSARAPTKARALESAPAATDDRDLPPALPEKDLRNGGKWYGGQILAIDGTALAMAALGFGQEESSLSTVGVIGFLVATPIVHAAHGKGGRAWGSVGLRLALPAGGAIVSAENPVIGAFIGAMGASVIDALRAYDDRPRKQRGATRRTMQLSPMVGRTVGGLTVGGSF